MSCRDEWVDSGMAGVTVPLKIPLFEVERLVAVASSLPGHRGAGKLTWLKLLTLKPALAGIVVTRNTGDVDVEVDRVKCVGSQFAQLFTAVFSGINAIAGRIDEGQIGNEIDLTSLRASGLVPKRLTAPAVVSGFTSLPGNLFGMV